MGFLQNIQNLPKNIRKYIMWSAIGVIVLFIFIFWLFVLLPQNSALEQREGNESLSQLKGQLQEGAKDFGEIQKQLSEAKEQYGEEKESSPEQINKESEPKKAEPRLPLESY